MIEELRGKVVIVTGGATGIGAAVSRAFGRCGCRVVVHHHTGAEAAAGLAEEIRAAGGEALTLPGDVTRPGVVEGIVDRAAETFGRIDVLVNNAGTMVGRRPLAEIDDAFFDAVFDLNARSVVRACKAALPIFRRQGGGAIINVSSISARTGGSPGSSLYSASKAFVATFTRALARELAPDRIRVNAVSPGTIHTRFHDTFSTPEKLERTRVTIPLERLGTPEDCAGTFLYLASDRLSGYVTGQVLEVNGGQLMP